MPVIRTPDDRFVDLPGYPFEPHYADLGGVQMHYLDAGDPASPETTLCLHGEPSWSYLYRKMVPILAEAGRVIAPDLIGFGKSDKFTDESEYSFQMHHDMIARFLDALDLRQITLVCQDWGGLIGLRIASEQPDRFARLVIMNTGLPSGEQPLTRAFYAWQASARRVTDLPVGKVIISGMAHGDLLPPDVIAAYEAPFPDASYKAGAKVFPALVPTMPDQPGAAEMRRTREALATWHKPALVMFSDGDPITHGGDQFFRDLIPSAREQAEITIHDAGHFLQEEKGEEIAHHIVDFIRRTSLP